MCPRSLRKALFVVEKFGVVDIWTFEDFGATFTDGHEGRARGVALAAAANGFEAFADSLDYGGSHGFARLGGELLGQLVGFGVLDVETHSLPLQIIVYLSILLTRGSKRKRPTPGAR